MPNTTCTTPGVPYGLYANNVSSYSPFIEGQVSCNGSSPGVWGFFKVYSGSTLVYSAETSSANDTGTLVATQVPTGDLRSGDTYMWYMYDCLNEAGTHLLGRHRQPDLDPRPAPQRRRQPGRQL